MEEIKMSFYDKYDRDKIIDLKKENKKSLMTFFVDNFPENDSIQF